jgi:hypothetical protein
MSCEYEIMKRLDAIQARLDAIEATLGGLAQLAAAVQTAKAESEALRAALAANTPKVNP